MILFPSVHHTRITENKMELTSPARGVRRGMEKERMGRVILAVGLVLVASTAVVGVFRGGRGGKIALYGMATEEALSELSFAGSGANALGLSGSCTACSARILARHQPWDPSSRIDPEGALSCTEEGACAEASKHAAYLAAMGALPHGVQELSQGAALGAASIDRMSKEQFMYDVSQLDTRQLALNWQRARVFARFAGAPRPAGTTYALATIVPPVDPKGRPVPAWLKFTPTAMSLFAMDEQVPGGATKAVQQQIATISQGGTSALDTVTPFTLPGGGTHHVESLAQVRDAQCPALIPLTLPPRHALPSLPTAAAHGAEFGHRQRQRFTAASLHPMSLSRPLKPCLFHLSGLRSAERVRVLHPKPLPVVWRL